MRTSEGLKNDVASLLNYKFLFGNYCSMTLPNSAYRKTAKDALNSVRENKTQRGHFRPKGWVLLFLAVLAVVYGLQHFGVLSSSLTPSIGGGGVSPHRVLKEKGEKVIHTIYQLKTERAVELSLLFNHKLARKARSHHLLNVDVLSGDAVMNYYSLPAKQRGVLDLKKYLELTDSSDVALVRAVQRVKESAQRLEGDQHLVVYLLAEGTNDINTIRTIQRIVQEIIPFQRKLRVYMMGLKPDYKLEMASAFHPIQSSMGGSCINEETQCLRFLEAITD
jgi:hypothetical protein